MSNTWFEALNAADGVLITGQEQWIVYWNEATRKITGYQGHEIVGSFCHTTLRGRSDRGQPICRENCCRAAAAARGSGTRRMPGASR